MLFSMSAFFFSQVLAELIVLLLEAEHGGREWKMQISLP
jgi:hypothetical protein